VIIAKNISPGLQNNSASQKEVYFRRAAPGEGGAHSGAVGGPGGNILFCDAESLCGYLKILLYADICGNSKKRTHR